MKVDLSQMQPGLTDRACFIGTTGSGKTTLARYVLNGVAGKGVLVFDSKDDLKWPGYYRYSTLKALIEANGPRMIYAPNAHEENDYRYHEGFFRFAFKRGNTTVYVDEVMHVTQRSELPDHYRAILTRGRSLGVNVFSGTQRPKTIPIPIMSESEHFYIFRLQLDADRSRVAEFTGLSAERLEVLPKHYFFYANNDVRGIGPMKLSL